MSGASIDRSAGLGARPAGDGRCVFTVWAPAADHVQVVLDDRVVEMEAGEHGYHQAAVDGIGAGARYRLRLPGLGDRPDPASRLQADGVHGASVVVDPSFPWTDHRWSGRPWEELVFYELHVGTFTPGGTFEAVIEHLPHLVDLGVTALELLPVAQFPGHRNWGYDGVLPFAAQSTYGGPDGLRRLVDACHGTGLAVILDVVYNHLGPEGCYLRDFGPYFTDRYRTPWGEALNFDGPGSDEVRRYFIESALMWVEECHVDGFRLDAVHAISDNTAWPFVEELAAAVHAKGEELGRRVVVVAEDAHNDPRISRPAAAGGWDLDGQWDDDIHHAIHVALTGERDGYYADFTGAADLSTTLQDGYLYGARRSTFRNHRVGRPAGDVDRRRLVGFSQNHDQVGNRAHGERLAELAGFEAAKVAAALVVLSPMVPLLFMGEEWADPAPFLYFVDHGDPGLLDAVRRGRQDEFAGFDWSGAVPDPAAPETFERSRVDHELRQKEPHRQMVDWYHRLLGLRRHHVRLGEGEVHVEGDCVIVGHGGRLYLVANSGTQPATVRLPGDAATVAVVVDSRHPAYGGDGETARVGAPTGGSSASSQETEVVLAGPAAVILELTG